MLMTSLSFLLFSENTMQFFDAEMETGRVARRVEILRPAGQAG